ncbi:ubiquinone biosynthesis protein [Lentzea xinjiangensis]|uniref:Ubiquinone biosynthesis protein n=1 Tax=Lentzea xinjiangensis TaxID=402600 RepID=A0A1H9LPP5_9PSEU|nr:AarF/UbiB family protein [Lentzea xinjiangensis]SER13219.1 ubiquinone biosynthesis protein [Lentzea xinjiangensis]
MREHRLWALVAALSRVVRSELHHGGRSGDDAAEGPSRAQRRAREVRLAFERLGPFYIKVGQMLSTRPDFVSEEMIAEFRTLHDTVSVQPFSLFEPVLIAELGSRWRGRFRTIDTSRPLGAASLAQVYAATQPDGRPVVVKIQRPGIVPLVTQDMALLRRAAKLVTKASPGFAEVIDVEAMLGLLFDAMRSELDFTLEARQMDRARADVAMFKHLDVPEVLLATPRVMIQSRAPGQSIRDANPADFPDAERLAIGRDLLAYMYRSYFTTKFFHADPHPGNIFVHPGEKASLIDWGMVGRIDRRTSQAILLVLTNVAMNDGQGLARAWTDLGRATDGADIAAFQNDMEALVPHVASASLEELNLGVTLTAILKSATKHRIRTNPAIAVLGKSFANLEGSIRYLAPELSITDTFRDQLSDIMLDLLEDTVSEQQLARTVLELVSGGTSAIQQMQNILRDLSSGRLHMRVTQIARLSPATQRRRMILGAALAFYLWRQRPQALRAAER